MVWELRTLCSRNDIHRAKSRSGRGVKFILRILERGRLESAVASSVHGDAPDFYGITPVLRMPPRILMARISAEEVRRSVSRLPEAQRRLIWDAFWTGKTHSQIAASSNLPLGTIKSRVRLGLARVLGDLTAPNELRAR